MKFRNKILFSIWGVVLSLLVITFFIINYWTRSRIEGTFRQELITASSTVLVHERLQSEQLIRACLVIAESPRLRAVAELGDAKTAYELLQELNRTTLSQIFILTDRQGRPLVQLLRGSRARWDISSPGVIQKALEFIASSDVWAVQGVAYRVVSVPIVIETDLVGTLTIGFEITGSDIATLKRATNSDLLLACNGAPVLSTMDSMEADLLLPTFLRSGEPSIEAAEDSSGKPIALTTARETYLGATVGLHHRSRGDSSSVFYLLIKPLSREVRSSMASILGTFGLVSLVFLVLTTVIGLVISRGMTRPIQQLVTGTTEISRGNYDYAIDVAGKDEMSFLARKFTDMSLSLKEKITQLGGLNRELTARNLDLDEALRKLQSAQEELLKSERLAATGKMTAQLAHEINNPIHNIQSLLESSLRKLDGQSRARELIGVALDEVVRMAKLTRQMLDIYRGSVADLEQDRVDLGDLLHDLSRSYQEPFLAQGIHIRLEVAPALPAVRGSRDKLKQVFLNLLINARDAMPEGGDLLLKAYPLHGSLCIEVNDTGVGIPPENLGRIFDAFFTTKKEVSGVGLGLTVSYGIIRQHNGTITVESNMGKGTSFTVRLPVAPDPGT